jgi:hypothetical protein
MIVPRTPDARRPGPSGPDRSSPSDRIAWSFRLEQPEHSFRESATHTATIRRSASLSVCGERTPRLSQASPTSARPTRLQAAGDAAGLFGEELAVLSHELAGRKRRTFGIRQHGQTNVRGVERWD